MIKMNKLLSTCIAILFVGLTSCGSDGECVTCSGEDPIFGLQISNEACDNEDGTITVSASVAGISQDSTYQGTLAEFRSENEAAGLTCE